MSFFSRHFSPGFEDITVGDVNFSMRICGTTLQHFILSRAREQLFKTVQHAFRTHNGSREGVIAEVASGASFQRFVGDIKRIGMDDLAQSLIQSYEAMGMTPPEDAGQMSEIAAMEVEEFEAILNALENPSATIRQKGSWVIDTSLADFLRDGFAPSKVYFCDVNFITDSDVELGELYILQEIRKDLFAEIKRIFKTTNHSADYISSVVEETGRTEEFQRLKNLFYAMEADRRGENVNDNDVAILDHDAATAATQDMFSIIDALICEKSRAGQRHR